MRLGLHVELNNNLPICVDLDGTLIRNDVTIIGIKKFLRQNKWNVFSVIYWFCFGRARLKYEIAQRIELDETDLILNFDFCVFLKQKKQEGFKLLLVTACAQKYADFVASYIRIFDNVVASDKKCNLRAQKKADKLVEFFGEKKFIYAGNSYDDLKVWKHAAQIIVVNSSNKVLKRLRNIPKIIFK